MERLSGLDASFLYLESRSQLMHVSGILELDPGTVEGGYRFEDLRSELARRITAMPAFRRKLHDSVINLDHPVWVEDENFDIEAHVHRVAAPAPGGKHELAELCAHVAGLPLDRSKPLWEMWVIEGLADGRIAIMMRMHHAGVDGVTGAGLMAQLCSLTPEPPPLDPEMVGRSTGGAPVWELAADGARNVLMRPLSLVSLIPRTLPVPVKWWSRARRGEAMPAPFSAPRTSLNSAITGHRSIAFANVPLETVKLIKDHYGVKVNDVVLAAVSGAIREFLHDRGELPQQPLVGMVPVSVHEAEIGATLVEGTNKVTGMFTRLTTDVEGPVGRLEAIRERVATSKEHHGELDDNLLRSWAQFAPASIMQLGAKLYGDNNIPELHPVVYNLVISNVPGPDFPLYFLGARIHSMYPLGPVFHGAGLNVTVFSQEGTLNIGVIACKKQVPDPWPIVRAFERDIAELAASVDGAGPTTDGGNP
ncbi:wax ester/triacylglycerol synthase family O-acyltransferase [Tsukamurella sp. 1534]|uniref:WS/DGAT/MGAT family O-acyltransferase n=1 Tax=Tsukamurella sp. 1534 TaxID=1151061 RepID=UPI0002E32A39|nr:wax ester/triacylglycerol synthase family O-acyltransferase [Tsukamurella sp. 1534]